MADTVFGIDKGIIKAFGLMVVVVGVLTTFFLSEYVSTIILGSVYQTSLITTNETSDTHEANNVPITQDAVDFIADSEDDFVTTFGNVNTGVKFAAALITVVAVILVFISFLPKKGRKDDSADY